MTSGDLYRRNPARDVERIAVRVVRSWVGGLGLVEDTSSGGGPDFKIRYSDGRTAIGEVSWNEDPDLREMWANTFRRDRHQVVELPEGLGTWSVHLALGAHIGRLYAELPGLLSELHSTGAERLDIYEAWPRGSLANAARGLGIEHAQHFDGEAPNEAMFFMPGKGGEIPSDPNVIADWIEQVLEDPAYADTTGKLLKLKADERHVLMMAGSATPFGAEERLRRLREGMPARSLNVPEGITHVWVLGQFGGSHTAMWSSDGWVRVPLPDLEGRTN